MTRGETTILNSVRGLDQRHTWMQVYNTLYQSKMIRPSESSDTAILRKIATDIAGIDQYAARTISGFFLTSSDHPIVREFIAHLESQKECCSISNSPINGEDQANPLTSL